jgi:hypothetical protein
MITKLTETGKAGRVPGGSVWGALRVPMDHSIHVKIGLDYHQLCLLVIIGVRAN